MPRLRPLLALVGCLFVGGAGLVLESNFAWTLSTVGGASCDAVCSNATGTLCAAAGFAEVTDRVTFFEAARVAGSKIPCSQTASHVDNQAYDFTPGYMQHGPGHVCHYTSSAPASCSGSGAKLNSVIYRLCPCEQSRQSRRRLLEQDPTGQPSSKPSGQPTVQPSGQPSGQPTAQPSGQPTRKADGGFIAKYTRCPTGQPSGQPTAQPSRQPTRQPSAQPSTNPTSQPTNPTAQPSSRPSVAPTLAMPIVTGGGGVFFFYHPDGACRSKSVYKIALNSNVTGGNSLNSCQWSASRKSYVQYQCGVNYNKFNQNKASYNVVLKSYGDAACATKPTSTRVLDTGAACSKASRGGVGGGLVGGGYRSVRCDVPSFIDAVRPYTYVLTTLYPESSCGRKGGPGVKTATILNVCAPVYDAAGSGAVLHYRKLTWLSGTKSADLGVDTVVEMQEDQYAAPDSACQTVPVATVKRRYASNKIDKTGPAHCFRDPSNPELFYQHVYGAHSVTLDSPRQPTARPTSTPTPQPTQPTTPPTTLPTVAPTTQPTCPSAAPTPTSRPSALPTVSPMPTVLPTARPSAAPTVPPTPAPTPVLSTLLNYNAGKAYIYAIYPYVFGVSATNSAAVRIYSIIYWKFADTQAQNLYANGVRTGAIYKTDGTQLGSTVTFTGETTAGWQTQQLPTPVLVPAGTTFVVAVNVPYDGSSRGADEFPAETSTVPKSVLPTSVGPFTDINSRFGTYTTTVSFPSGGSQNINRLIDFTYVLV